MDSVSGCNPFQRSIVPLLAILPLPVTASNFPVPFGLTATRRVQMEEDAWNSRDPGAWRSMAAARILDGLGLEALATPSAASACAVGRRDGGLTRDEALAHADTIVNATDLPVSADLQRGFGDAPDIVGETIRLAADAGLVGFSRRG